MQPLTFDVLSNKLKVAIPFYTAKHFKKKIFTEFQVSCEGELFQDQETTIVVYVIDEEEKLKNIVSRLGSSGFNPVPLSNPPNP